MSPPKPNGFSIFMNEYIDNQKRSGRHISKVQAAAECNPLWQNMDDATKLEYKDRAKKTNRGTTLQKLTSDGQVIEHVQRREQERVLFERKLSADARAMVLNSSKDELCDKRWIFIHCNLFCKTVRDDFIPAEISMSEFTLRSGETAILHQLINPVEIPLGYRSDAFHSISTVHCIPLPPYDDDECLLMKDASAPEEAYGKIQEWIQERGMPILFAWDHHVENVRGALKTLARKCGEEAKFRVVAASQLLFNLQNRLMKEIGEHSAAFPLLDVAIEELNRDTFSHVEYIACEFHQNNPKSVEKLQNCSLSSIRRIAFTICNHCCSPLNIDMKAGVHYPEVKSFINNLKSKLDSRDNWSVVGGSRRAAHH